MEAIESFQKVKCHDHICILKTFFIWKLTASIYLHNEQPRNKNEHNSVYNSIKIIKCLELNLIKEVENLYPSNFKTLLKEIKQDLNNLKDIPHSMIRNVTLWRWQSSPDGSTDPTKSLSKSQLSFLQNLKK